MTDKQIQGVFKRFSKNQDLAFSWIDKSFLTDEMKEAYKNTLNLKYAQLGLSD